MKTSPRLSGITPDQYLDLILAAADGDKRAKALVMYRRGKMSAEEISEAAGCKVSTLRNWIYEFHHPPERRIRKKKVELVLSETERNELNRISNEGSTDRARKAQAILLYAEGETLERIALAVGLKWGTVLYRARQFASRRLRALQHGAIGKRDAFPKELEKRLRAILKQPPPNGRGRWTQQMLSDRALEWGYKVSGATIRDYIPYKRPPPKKIKHKDPRTRKVFPVELEFRLRAVMEQSAPPAGHKSWTYKALNEQARIWGFRLSWGTIRYYMPYEWNPANRGIGKKKRSRTEEVREQ